MTEKNDLPSGLLMFIAEQRQYRVLDWSAGDYEGDNRVQPDDDIYTANVVTSAVKGVFLPNHRPVLDIDVPAYLVPSTTPGHSHLYIDKEMSWSQYARLLNVLVDAGIIEEGYLGASLARGDTTVRLPWIKKEI
jgi:hypothetical protein